MASGFLKSLTSSRQITQEEVNATAMSNKVRIHFSDIEGSEDLTERMITLEYPNYKLILGRGSPSDAEIAPTENNLLFSSKVVSRHHAVITADAISKKIFIRDNGSMHGTYIDGSKIGADRMQIHQGDIITFGQQVVRGAETFEPLRLSVSFAWLSGSTAEISRPQASAQGQAARNTGNTFTVDYSDVDSDDELEFISSKKVNVIEIDSQDITKPTSSSVETSPQSKKSVDLTDSPTTSASSVDFGIELPKDGEEAEKVPETNPPVADDDWTGRPNFDLTDSEVSNFGDEHDPEIEASDDEADDYVSEDDHSVDHQNDEPDVNVPAFTIQGLPQFHPELPQQGIPRPLGPVPQIPTQFGIPPPQFRPAFDWSGMTARSHSPSDVALAGSNLNNNLYGIHPPFQDRPAGHAPPHAPPGFNVAGQMTWMSGADMTTRPPVPRISNPQKYTSTIHQMQQPFTGEWSSFRPQTRPERLSEQPLLERSIIEKSSSEIDIDAMKHQSPAAQNLSAFRESLIATSGSGTSKRKFDKLEDGKLEGASSSAIKMSVDKSEKMALDGILADILKEPREDAVVSANQEVDSNVSEADEHSDDDVLVDDNNVYAEDERQISQPDHPSMVQAEAEAEMPPRKKARIERRDAPARPSFTRSLIKNTAMVLTGAAVGAVGTVFTLANLPPNYFV